MASIYKPPPPSRLLCPAIRIKYSKNQSHKKICESSYHIVDNSFYLSNPKDDLYPHSHFLLPLFWCNNKEPLLLSIDDEIIEENCGACWHNTTGTTYYFCGTCDRWYHKECVESPSIFMSPYHPKHSLQLYKFDDWRIHEWLECFSCGSYRTGLVYHCSICDFNLDPVCVRKPPLINHQKRHEHTLYFFPRKYSLICDVCGLGDTKSFIFVCLRCDFIVHRNCIYLPYVIKISRHKHRISFVYSLPSQEWYCGVCRHKIDGNYGAYSCMMKDCIYVVHSKCATNPKLWDRKELEEEPEEEANEIMPPFEEMSDGTILHFSHSEHPMRLCEDVKTWYDEETRCQACMLPLYDGKTYTCTYVECDYVLHEACAYLPRVIHHPLHFHSLTLEPSCTTKRACQLCPRDSFGFKYVCSKVCDKSIILDVRCASISEPYIHHSHRDPLFITTTEDWPSCCSICGGKTTGATLDCDRCLFVLCYGCATLPHKVRYKNDEHLLTFSCEKRANGSIYWCDACEETIDPNTGFYICSECEVTLHISCLLGADMYMNPGSSIKLPRTEFDIIPNSSLTRPICSGCRKRCKYTMLFLASSGEIYCSIGDIYSYHYKANEWFSNFFTEWKNEEKAMCST